MSLRTSARRNAPRLSIGLALALSAIGLLTVISLRLDGDLQRRSDLLTHTAVVEGNLARMESDLLAAETGQRGFLLTGDSSYLDSYLAALPSIPRELAALQELLAQSPPQQQRLLTVQQLVQAKLTELHESIELRGQRDESAATAVMTHGRGRRLMEALRGELADMRIAEGAQLQERSRLREGAAVASRNSQLLESGILALALLLTVFVYRSQVRQARAEAELDRVISELRAAEAALRSHARSLEQNVAERTRLLETRAAELARSNEELERFAYVASHDLQEPLRMVTNFTQLLQHRYRGKLGTDADEFIEYAVTGVERMHALIKDLLTYSRARTRPLEPETVDLRSVVREAERILQLSITESAAEVTCDWMPTVRVDATQMTQVFQNLLSNAIKFRATAPPRVRISSELLGGVWLISVEDNGVGVAPEHGERIFIIFQRLHGREEYPGTGVGLAICRQIVERHGGRIWVESRPGGGAVFQFTLPVTNAESPPFPAEQLD